MELLKKAGKYSDLILKLGLGFVFVYFGIDKFIHPSYWSGFIPDWFMVPISITLFIYLMGAAETIVGLGLFTKYSRYFALIAALMLAGITIGIGWNDLSVRDMGLLAIAVALVLKK